MPDSKQRIGNLGSTRRMIQALLLASGGLVVPSPVTAPTLAHVQAHATVLHSLPSQQPERASSMVFPTTTTLAVGYEGEPNVYSEEDKAKARNAGLGLLFFGIAPSIWAQNELVWSKDKKSEKK